jgi:hypothetical protein
MFDYDCLDATLPSCSVEVAFWNSAWLLRFWPCSLLSEIVQSLQALLSLLISSVLVPAQCVSAIVWSCCCSFGLVWDGCPVSGGEHRGIIAIPTHLKLAVPPLVLFPFCRACLVISDCNPYIVILFALYLNE